MTKKTEQAMRDRKFLACGCVVGALMERTCPEAAQLASAAKALTFGPEESYRAAIAAYLNHRKGA